MLKLKSKTREVVLDGILIDCYTNLKWFLEQAYASEGDFTFLLKHDKGKISPISFFSDLTEEEKKLLSASPCFRALFSYKHRIGEEKFNETLKSLFSKLRRLIKNASLVRDGKLPLTTSSEKDDPCKDFVDSVNQEGYLCVFSEGSLREHDWILGMAPAENECEQGKPFVGRAGQKLNDILGELGVARSNFYITNAVKCFVPPSVNIPLRVVSNCSRLLLLELIFSDVARIIVLGDIARKGLSKALIGVANIKFNRGERTTVKGRFNLFGEVIEKAVDIITTYHPSYVLRNPRSFSVVVGDIKNFLDIPDTSVNYKVITTPAELKDTLNDLFPQLEGDKYHLITLDLETEKLDSVRKNKIICVAIGYKDRHALVIPFYTYDRLFNELRYLVPEHEINELKSILKDFLTRKDIRIVGHNIKYDALVLKRNLGIDIVDNILADTKIMHRLIREDPPHDLKTLTVMYGSFGHYASDVKDSFKEGEWYKEMSPESIWRYCAIDVCATYELFNVFLAKLRVIAKKQRAIMSSLNDAIKRDEELGLRRPQLFYMNSDILELLKLVMRNYKLAIRMEEVGCPVSRSYLDGLKKELDLEIKDVEKQLVAFTGYDINWSSHKQLSDVLRKLNLPVLKTTKSGAPSYDKEVLARLAEQGYKVAELILKHRNLIKMRGTYAEMLKKYPHKVVSVNGDIYRLAPDIDVNGTETGRWSVKDPPMHTIPRDNRYRNLVQAEKGKVIMSADYSIAELWCLAAYSACKSMLDDLRAGVDFHRLTGARIFNKDPEDITSEERTICKSINYGIPYGISPKRLAANLNIPVEEARKFIDMWFEARPEVYEFLKMIEEHYESFEEGALVSFVNIFGRARRVVRHPKYTKSGRINPEFSHTIREVKNFYPQSTVADILHKGMDRLDAFLWDRGLAPYCRILLTVHDATLLEVDETKVEEVASVVKEALEFPIKFAYDTITIPVDISWDRVWKKD